MTKKQFKNLSHSFRYMRKFVGKIESLNWIGHYSRNDYYVLLNTIGNL
jgi:hypothetical protein